jgi:hypothetical protein
MDAPLRKFSVGGLKLSLELIQIRLLSEAGVTAAEIFRRLADKQINLAGVTLDALDGQPAGVCYLSAEDRSSAECALEPFKNSFEILAPVGALTIFPLQSRLELIGRLLSALNSIGLPVYGMATSLSSLTITTDYRRLDEAVSAVCQVVTLPDNHAPFRPEFRIKQL